MSFAAFDDQPLKKFLEQQGDDGNLWIFIHIPKTAGSSLSTEIAAQMKPYRNIHIDYRDPSIPHNQQMDAAVDRFIEDAKTIRFRSCSGHIQMRHAKRIQAALPHAKIVTVLREPTDRIVSDFRYARTPMHPPHQQFIKDYPTFKDYIESPESRNKMFRFLAPDINMPLDEALDAIDAEMTFIGLLEMYPLSFNILFRLFGLDAMPKVHKRKTEANEHNEVEINDALQDRIIADNAKDYALFNHVRRKLKAKREDWMALRKERQAAAKVG